MVEAQKYRLEQEMTNLVNELDRSHLRKMQGDMHRCAAKCCDDPQTSLERVHGCIDNCTAQLNQANNYVQGEINHLQNRLQRCIMDCNDAARDRLGPDPSQETIDKCTIDFEKCAVKCVDKHIALIPSLMKTMKNVLASGPCEVDYLQAFGDEGSERFYSLLHNCACEDIGGHSNFFRRLLLSNCLYTPAVHPRQLKPNSPVYDSRFSARAIPFVNASSDFRSCYDIFSV